MQARRKDTQFEALSEQNCELTAEVERLKKVEVKMTEVEVRRIRLESQDQASRTAPARNTPKNKKPVGAEIAPVGN